MAGQPLGKRWGEGDHADGDREREQRHRSKRARVCLGEEERQDERPRPVAGGADGDGAAQEVEELPPLLDSPFLWLRRRRLAAA